MTDRSDAHPDGKLMDHEYDGIREYDNPLPGWWTWLWVLSMVFSVGYVSYYHIGLGPSVHDEYRSAVAASVERLLAQLGDVRPDNETIMMLMNKTDWMDATSGMFVGNCAQCHAADGGGNIGPNLTDEHYINVTEPADLFQVITNGVPGKGMQAWGDRLGEPQRILLAAYVASLRGTQPAGGKEAEGDVIDPWPVFDNVTDEVVPASPPASSGSGAPDAS